MTFGNTKSMVIGIKEPPQSKSTKNFFKKSKQPSIRKMPVQLQEDSGHQNNR